MISLFKKQNIIKPLVSVLLVLSIILVAYGPTEKTPRAEAIPVTGFVTTTEVGGPMLPAVLATAVSSGDTAFNTGSLAVAWITKESGIGGAFSLDAIAWFAINLIIHQLAQEIISWINSGFQGSPAFMSDLEGFLRGVADRVAGEFIYGSELGFLCSPFRLNVQLALAIQYGKGRNFETHCTLSNAVSNVNNFLNGDFLAGGWDGWYSMTQDPRNNPHGALLLAQEQLSVRLSGTKGNELKLLDFSKGFFNVRQCQPDDSDAPGHCTTVTPGSAIENQLNSALEMPTNRLMVADEINEILSALFSQLVSTVFNSAGGLLGLTNSSYGSGNYFSLLASSTAIVGATGTAPIYTPPGGGVGGAGSLCNGIFWPASMSANPPAGIVGPQFASGFRFPSPFGDDAQYAPNLAQAGYGAPFAASNPYAKMELNFNWLMDTYGSGYAYSYMVSVVPVATFSNQFRWAIGDPLGAQIVNSFMGQGCYGPTGSCDFRGVVSQDGGTLNMTMIDGVQNGVQSIVLPYPTGTTQSPTPALSASAGVTPPVCSGGGGGGGGGGTVSCPATNAQGIPYNNSLPLAPLTGWTLAQKYSYWLSLPDNPYQLPVVNALTPPQPTWAQSLRYNMYNSLGGGGATGFQGYVDLHFPLFTGCVPNEGCTARAQWINGNNMYFSGSGFSTATGIGFHFDPSSGATVPAYPASGIPRTVACATGGGGGGGGAVQPAFPWTILGVQYTSQTQFNAAVAANTFMSQSVRINGYTVTTGFGPGIDGTSP